MSGIYGLFQRDGAPVDQAEFLANVRAIHGSSVSGLGVSGWISFKIAQTVNLKRGAEAIEQIESTARAEGRAPSADDFRAVKDVAGLPVPGQSVQAGKASITYSEIKVADRWAEVTYDDGAALARAFLVKTRAGWRIAGVRAINIHF